MGLAPPEQKEKKSCLRCEIEFKEPETGKPSEYVPQFKQLDGGTQTLEGYICREQKYCRARCFKKATGINPIGPYADISRDYWLFNMDPRPDDWEKVKWRPVPGLKLRERAMAAIVYHSWCFPVCLPFACQINHRDDDIEMLAGEPVHLTRELLAKILGAPQPHVWAACEALVLQGRLFIDEYGVLWPRMHPSLALKDRGGEFQAERRNKGDKYLDPIAKELTAAGYGSGDPASRAAFDDAREVRKIFTTDLRALRQKEKAGYLKVVQNIKSGLYKTRVYESAETTCTDGESGEYNGSHLIVSSSASNTVRTYARASATAVQPPPEASLSHECAQENPCNQEYGCVTETPASLQRLNGTPAAHPESATAWWKKIVTRGPWSEADVTLFFATVAGWQRREPKVRFGQSPISTDRPGDCKFAAGVLDRVAGEYEDQARGIVADHRPSDLRAFLNFAERKLFPDANSLGKSIKSIGILNGFAEEFHSEYPGTYGETARREAESGRRAAHDAEVRQRATARDEALQIAAMRGWRGLSEADRSERLDRNKGAVRAVNAKSWELLPAEDRRQRAEALAIGQIRRQLEDQATSEAWERAERVFEAIPGPERDTRTGRWEAICRDDDLERWEILDAEGRERLVRAAVLLELIRELAGQNAFQIGG